MTDELGHRPRLSTVALLAPAAAAVLAGSLAWATGHPPAAPLTKSAAAASPTPDGSAAERARQLRDLERLRKQVASLRGELTDLAGADNSQSDARGGSGTGRATAKPKPKPARTPPPVQATTGAS